MKNFGVRVWFGFLYQTHKCGLWVKIKRSAITPSKWPEADLPGEKTTQDKPT